MAAGTVSTCILIDMANAIRYQVQPYMTFESGVLPESVFSGIADAIRGENGESMLYQPGDMAAAVLTLEWDVGYKIRALLLDGGTLEVNYYERRTSVAGRRIVQAFEIDPTGYSSASARSCGSIKLLVKKGYIDSSIAGLGITDCNCWFNAFSNCTEVRSFENLSGEGVLTATSAPDVTRELFASRRICAIGKYVGLGSALGSTSRARPSRRTWRRFRT